MSPHEPEPGPYAMNERSSNNRAIDEVAAFAHDLSIQVSQATRALATLGDMNNPKASEAKAALAAALATIRRTIDKAMQTAVDRSAATGSRSDSIHRLPSPTDRHGTGGDMQECLGDTLRRVLRSLGPLAESAHVGLRIECEGDAVNIPAGPLEHVLANTIRNAIDSCTRISSLEEERVVTVALRRRGSRLVIDVVDNGPGLSDVLASPTSLTGASVSEVRHESDLAMVRRTIASLDGSMELTNVPFGRGAVFCADIPISRLTTRRAA